MRRGARGFALLLATSLAAASVAALPKNDSETRVLRYVRDHLQPGQPLVVSDLYNKVFTQPAERRALNKLYNAFFRIPLFVAGYQDRFGSPPRLRTIAQQFDLKSAESADILLRVMETDPRVPRFITRDPKTHEITRVDVERIKNDPRFGAAVSRQLGGWEGRPAPAFDLEAFQGPRVSSKGASGKVLLLYVWFTGCPPCMKEAPSLVALNRKYASSDLVIVGANADRLLGLDYSDAARARYIQKEKIGFPVVHWTKEADRAYGNISIFPTLFLIGRDGVILRHWVGYTDERDLRRSILTAFGGTRSGR